MKNRNILTNSIACALCLLQLSSCAEFLEPKSENEFVPRTVQSLDELLLFHTYNDRTFRTVTYFNLLTDDVSVVPFIGGQPDLFGAVHLSSLKAIYTWQPDMYYTLEEDHVDAHTYDMYSGGYERILGCNAVLEYIDKVEGDAMEKTRLSAEAKALRAYWYFYLVNIYGQPYCLAPDSQGVPLQLGAKVSSAFIPRNTVKECYDQVLSDLHEAERLFESLPEELQWSRNMRVSLPFVQLMLSRVYLYMENWTEASAYAGKVIANPNFHLLELADFPEDSYVEVHSYSCPEVIWAYGWASEFNDFENPYMMVSSAGGKVSFVVASTDLVYSFDIDDIRLKHYMVQDPHSVNRRAYGKIALNQGNNDPLSENHFVRSLRLSEAYLNKAEAEAQLFKAGGDDANKQASLLAVNALRQRRILDYDNPSAKNAIDSRTGAKLVESIRAERRRELCFEDHRWFDLRRYGTKRIDHVWYDGTTTSSYSIYTLNVEDPQYTLPLPPDVLLLNKALEQNPLGPKRNPMN